MFVGALVALTDDKVKKKSFEDWAPIDNIFGRQILQSVVKT